MSRHCIEEIGSIIIVVLIWVAFIWGLMHLGGCSIIGRTGTTPVITPAVPTTALAVINNIKSTDWLNTLFLLAFVGSIFAGLNGLKAGWAGAAASLAGIAMKGALTQLWIYWILGVLLVAAILLVAASILMRKKALVEIIRGAQNLKKLVQADDAKILAEPQSKPTQKIVADIKTDLKLKGVI